jgi:hypothetical protein
MKKIELPNIVFVPFTPNKMPFVKLLEEAYRLMALHYIAE